MTQKEKPFAIHISDSNISEICKRVMKKYESEGERKQDTLKKIMIVAMNSKEGQYRYVENLNPVYDIIDRLTGQMNDIVSNLINEKKKANEKETMAVQHLCESSEAYFKDIEVLENKFIQRKQAMKREIQNQKEKYNNIEEKYNFAKKLVNELEEKLEKYKGLEEKYDLLEKEYKELSKKYNEQVLELARIKS